MNRFLMRVILAVCISVCLPQASSQLVPALESTAALQLYTLPVTRGLNSVAFGNGIFVAVGPSFTILISPDGTNWSNASSTYTNVININFGAETFAAGGDSITFVVSHGTTNKPSRSKPSPELRAITFGDGKFAAVGDDGVIAISADGKNWSAADSKTHEILDGITWGLSQFVAVGLNGIILTSPNGIEWTPRNSGTVKALFGVAYGNNTFVTVGENATVLTSADGVTWKLEAEIDFSMECIAFGNGVFMGASANTSVPVCYVDNNETAVSRDGKTWRQISHPPHPNGSDGNGQPTGQTSLSFVRDSFMAATSEGVFVFSETKGWIKSSHPLGIQWSYSGVAYGNGVYVAVGDGQGKWPDLRGGTYGSSIAISRDAAYWVPTGSPPSRLLWGHLNKRHDFIPQSVGWPRRLVLYTTDDVKWVVPDGSSSVSGNVSGNSIIYFFREGTNSRAVMTSQDGITWTPLRPIRSDFSNNLTTTGGMAGSADVGESKIGVQFELNGQQYKLNLSAKVGQVYELQASFDLQLWENLIILTNNGQALGFVDQEAARFPQRFYRLKPR